MGGTGFSRTCFWAGGAPGREGREEAEHRDTSGAACNPTKRKPRNLLGGEVEAVQVGNTGFLARA